MNWSGAIRVGQCGINKYGKVDTRFCGETFQFRELVTPLGKWQETICPICSLKWDIMAATVFKDRYRLCEELAQVLATDPYSAYLIASRSFKFSSNHCAPVRPPLNPKPAITYRSPYTE